MINNDCRCPGCGECTAKIDAPKLKGQLKALKSQRDDLLEALKLARTICNNLIGHPDDEHGKFIDAAIKKAEGG
jgi:hypothetical protein